MLQAVGERMWLAEGVEPGPALAISFGVHGNERPPIEAGLRLVRELETGELFVARGRLLLIHANALASEQGARWSAGGVDLNRCFSRRSLAAEPTRYEERRAREIAGALERVRPEVLVDFHCTVEPGDPFLVQHPPVDHAPSREVLRLLSAKVLLTDPDLVFGAVSLDEWTATRGKVGICFETGWIRSPACTPASVLEEMLNVLAGHAMLPGIEARHHDEKTPLRLDRVVLCEGDGFAWREGVGENLQALPAGTVLGAYADGSELTLPIDATLFFPKKRPELVERESPLVYLGVAPS
jgi:predicted deacylase